MFIPLNQNVVNQSGVWYHITACLHNPTLPPYRVSVSQTDLFTVCQTAVYKNGQIKQSDKIVVKTDKIVRKTVLGQIK